MFSKSLLEIMTHRLRTAFLGDDKGLFHQDELGFCFSTPGNTTVSRDSVSMENLSSQWTNVELEPQEDVEKFRDPYSV